MTRTGNADILPSVLSCLLLLLFLVPQNGDSVWQRLKTRYLSLKSLSGSFSETLNSEFDTTAQRFSGTFTLRLPHCYRIEVREPVRQTIVGDSSVLWFHFSTERRALRQRGGGSVPLLAFLGPMLDTLAVPTLDREPDGRARLSVASPDSGLEFSEFVFLLDAAGTGIAGFAFVDAWGNRYRFELSRLQWNPKIPAKTFSFTPPAGTAVDSLGP